MSILRYRVDLFELFAILVSIKLCVYFGIKNATLYSDSFNIVDALNGKHEKIKLSIDTIINEINHVIYTYDLTISFKWISREKNVADELSRGNMISKNIIDDGFINDIDLFAKLEKIMKEHAIHVVSELDSGMVEKSKNCTSINFGKYVSVFRSKKIYIFLNDGYQLNSLLLAISFAYGLFHHCIRFASYDDEIIRYGKVFCKWHRIEHIDFTSIKMIRYRP